MPLDYSLLNAPQIDVMGNYQRGVGMSQQNAQNQMQQMEMINQMQRKNKLSDLLNTSGGDLQSLVPKLAQGGFLPEAASVQALIQARQPKYEADWQRPGWKEAEQFKAGLKPEKPVEWRELQTDKGIMQVNPATGQLRPLGVNPVKKSDEDTNWTVIQTENGYAQVNPKTGQVRQLGVSKPMNPLIEAKLKESEIAKSQQKEQQSLSAQQVLDQAALLYQHPGRQMATGASSFMSAIPGTDAKGFAANLATFKAQTFVPMVSALKGMGALSDAEGKKLSESVGALDPSMSEEEFARSLQSITRFLYEKGRAAGLNVSLPDFAVGQQTGATGQFGTRSGATTSGW